MEPTIVKPYARILMIDGRPVVRAHVELGVVDVPLSATAIFLLMREGFDALVQLAQAGQLPRFIEKSGFIEETKP